MSRLKHRSRRLRLHRRPRRALLLVAAAAAAAASLAPSRSSEAVTFNFTPTAGTSQQAVDGFVAAGQRWSSLLADDVTVNIAIGFAPIAGGALGTTTSSQTNYPYANARTALVGDAVSADDFTATAALQPAPAARLLINYTSNSPHGVGSPTPYLDNNASGNNANVRIHHANAKALGLRSPANAASDAAISFSSSYAWDFNPYDGIASGAFDFVGVATHEIAHVLGFSSGVDLLDTSSPGGAGTFLAEDDVHTKAMDLFRYSTESKAHGSGVFDMSADARAKYFSIDGGTTSLGGFSTGRLKGDGQQAGHWKDNQNLGLMDPTPPTGAQQFISALDRRALDVLGWNPNNKWLWMDPAGGNFDSAIRWSSTAVPQAGQQVTWNLNGAYTIAFTEPATTASAQVRAGAVMFDLGGTTYMAGAALDLAPATGEAGTLHVTGGTLSATNVNVGGTTTAGGGTGVLSIGSGATLNAPATVRVWSGGTLKFNGGNVSTAKIQLNGGTIQTAVSAATTAVPITANGGTVQVDDAAAHTHAGPLTTTGGTLEKTGGGTLVIAGPQTHAATAMLKTSAGTTVLDTNAGSISSTGTLSVIANAATNFRATQNLKSLAVGSGATVTLNSAVASPGTRSIKTSAIDVDTAGGGRLDLRDNVLVVDYDAASSVARVHELLAAAHNFSAWDLPGIGTSNAGTEGLYGLACGEASDILGISGSDTAMWGGQVVDGTAVLVRFTYDGDANLDGYIDAVDYGYIDNWIQFPGTNGYWNGDFNYDGVIDAADYGIIDNSIQLQGAPLPWLLSASAVSVAGAPVTAVPEPAACLVAAMCAAASLMRRRRRRCVDNSSARARA